MPYLIVKAGSEKDAHWPVGSEPLVIGRDSHCPIALTDPLASRRHCKVWTSREGLHIEDLGSSNATLVNGAPVTSAVLHPGDEITIGRTVMTVADNPPAQPRVESLDETTVNIPEGEAIYLANGADPEATMAQSGDIAQLYITARALSRARKLDEFFDALGLALCARLDPEAAWAGLGDGGTGAFDLLLRYCAPEVAWSAPEEAMAHALRRSSGVILPNRVSDGGRKALRLSLIAPLIFAERRLGALVVQARTAHRAYDERDLHYLVALAHTAAPLLAALQDRAELESRIERLQELQQDGHVLIGKCPALDEVRRRIAQVAPADVPVLVCGETGTGKEIVARLIHDASGRAGKPLVSVNCAAIPDELFASELFGHEKGAFTGAANRRIGLLEQSDGGTLFLDEIGDLSPDNQAGILRALESGAFRRVGGNSELNADFRLVAATNKDLDAAMVEGQFREDLYHRLCGMRLVLPPLRERLDDLPELVNHFVATFSAQARQPVTGLEPEAMERLRSHTWPGNVRELRNVVKTATALCRGERISAEEIEACIPSALRERRPTSMAEMERKLIDDALAYCGGNVVEAAKLIGVSKDTIYRRLARAKAGAN
jgi:Nif-specific regulatory protein